MSYLFNVSGLQVGNSLRVFRIWEAQLLTKSTHRIEKPWRSYHKESGKLLEPGWAGPLDDGELEYILARLREDDSLSYWWGFRPGQKSRSSAAIQRVALYGDPDTRRINVKLARSRRPMIVPEKGR